MIIVDGMSDFYKHYWKLSRIIGPHVAGFMGMIRGVFSYKKMDSDVRIVWEGKSALRKAINVLYKGDRKRMPESFYEQLNDTQSFLSNFLKQYMVDEYESDDLCATIAFKRNRMDKPTTIITGDGDLHQIVNKNIKIYNPAREIETNINNFESQYTKEMQPCQLLWLWGLEGDKSDNIPGIKGLHKKEEIVLAYGPTYTDLILSDTEFEAGAEEFINHMMDNQKNVIGIKDIVKIKANEKQIYDNLNLLRLRMVPMENYKKILPIESPEKLIEKYKCFKSLTGYLEEENSNARD
jgi:5'-3' exonuclease